MNPRLAIIVALVAIVAPAPVASAVQGDQREQLERNVAVWGDQHLHDYRFRLRVRCFCPSARHAVTVTVRDGRPVGAAGFQRRLDTVPELFDAIHRALDDPKAGAVTVRYDGRRGFPRTASIDQIKNAIDDEIGWTVDRFRPLRRH
jgi:hypothetical protein